MVFAGSSGFLHYVQLASHELATIGINVTKNKIPNACSETTISPIGQWVCCADWGWGLFTRAIYWLSVTHHGAWMQQTRLQSNLMGYCWNARLDIGSQGRPNSTLLALGSFMHTRCLLSTLTKWSMENVPENFRIFLRKIHGFMRSPSNICKGQHICKYFKNYLLFQEKFSMTVFHTAAANFLQFRP